MKTLGTVLFVIFTLIAASAFAQTVPELINYQGKLVDGTNLINGTVPITFHLYDAPSGAGLSYCTDSNDVVVVDGLYSTFIGDNVTFGGLDNALVQTQVWVEVIIGTNVLSPREQLVSGGFSRYAAKMPANAVKMDMIAPDQIQSWHIADGQVRGSDIQAGTISNSVIADGAIYGDKIADGSISNVKYGFESVDLNAIAQNAVQFWHIADGSVRSNHVSWTKMPSGLQDGDNDTTYSAGTGLGLAGTTFSVTNGAIGNDQLAANAVTGAKIANATIGGEKIQAGTISNALLAASSVTSAKIQDSTILFADIAQNGAASGQFVKWSGSSWTPGGADTAANRIPITNAGFVIRQPGSYYLPTNLICVGSSGIIIATNDITLDLNGFSIIGDGSGNWGIYASAGYKNNFTLRNGAVTGFGQLGMDVSVIRGSHVENVTVVGNGASGMAVGAKSLIINCRAIQNGQVGIFGDDRSVIRDCIAAENGGEGIYAEPGSLVLNCVAYSNRDAGIIVHFNGYVRDCVATFNSSNGIFGAEGSKISGNVSSYNAHHGIAVYAGTIVENNECTYNGQTSPDGAGIYAQASRNRIEENHVLYNDTGIWAPTSPNFIVKNTASGNTTEYNVSAAAGNPFAPLDTSGAFTNAWANFDF
ncbi:MAG: hypothetical protein AB7T27_01480 [Kiritimatiellia bacterium]